MPAPQKPAAPAPVAVKPEKPAPSASAVARMKASELAKLPK